MPTLNEIKTEIVNFIKTKYSKNGEWSSFIDKVDKEISTLENTIGLDNKNNLESFYNIWKKNSDKVGSKNSINSWTAYCLGMTNKKPDGEFLPTRRAFARAGFPDIDTDFDYENRDKVYQYIIDRYGRENVGNIGTHGLLKFKSCVTRVTKALDLANAFHKGKDAFISENAAKASDILSPFPKKGLVKIKDDSGEFHLIKNFSKAYKHCSDFRKQVDRYESESFKSHIQCLEGTFANFGSHAAGIVVSDVPLNQIAPLRKATKGFLATQFPNEDLEQLGLIKFDILAISTLSVIKKAVRMIKDYLDIEIDIENLPLDSDAALKLYRDGNLGGIFQCENYGMQDTMKKIGVDRFEDIVAGLALYRPGPMDSIDDYCARKRGDSPIDYFNPVIKKYVEPYLKRTYGILCYQEQIMQICNALAGFSISDGYVMIKAIGKKKEYLMTMFEKQFIEGCVSKGVPSKVAKDYWDKFIVPFAGYGFNLAHSCCYAYLSYTTAYLKANYPDEFMCSLLDVTISSGTGDRYDKVGIFEAEFKKKMGVKILPRDINKSKFSYTIEKRRNLKENVLKTEIRPSLLFKGIGIEAAKFIEKNQPYSSMEDFFLKIDSSVVDIRTIESLSEGGYFSSWKKKTTEEILKSFVMFREDAKKTSKRKIESKDIFA